MNSIYTPAIYLANRLKYAQKFLLLGLISILIIFFLIVVLHQQLNKVIVDTTTQLEGVEQIVAVNELIRLAQQYRGLSAADTGDNILFAEMHHKKGSMKK
jgi:hypothetical protein